MKRRCRGPLAEGAILDSTEIEIALYGLEAPPNDDGRLEPLFALAPVMIGFDEPDQPVLDNEPGVDGAVRFQPELLDLAKAADEPEEPYPEPFPLPRLGPAGSFMLHLLLLVVLLTWPDTPMEASNPIPVQLVIEQPPPQPQQQPRPSAPPPPEQQVMRSSEDMGNVTPAPKPEESVAAETPPPPAPEKAPTEQSPPPKPPPLPQKEASVIPPPPPPKPAPPPPRPALHAATKTAAPVSPKLPKVAYHPPARRASVEGPPATRDEYLATLVRLTKRHINLLPMSLLGDRRGETRIGVRVLDDGTIANVAVVESSGYPDIDRRIEQMVLAVGRFPPLPQWFQGRDMQLELRLRFPDALQD
jgi:periplasmic protein TonB